MQDRVLPREAAERLLCSTRRIERWIQAGKLPKGVDGKVDFAKARQLNLSQKTGRPPGKLPRKIGELLTRLSPKERDLIKPLLEAHGQRRFERMIDALALAARNWTPAKRKRWAKKLSDTADRVKLAEPTERRERERKRLTDASHTCTAKKSRTIVYPQIGADAPKVEFIPFFFGGISPEDEKYVLLEAGDPSEFLKRAKERDIEVSLEKSDPAVRRGRAFDQDYTPDIAAEIDSKNESSGQPDTAEDILATYASITGAAEKRRFLLANKPAIRAARASARKRYNFEHMLNLAERKKWKWVKTDDGYAFKAVPSNIGALGEADSI
jgi:hypothetical protein